MINPQDMPKSPRLRANLSEPIYFSTVLGGRDESSALCNTEGQGSHGLGKRPQSPYVGIQLQTQFQPKYSGIQVTMSVEPTRQSLAKSSGRRYHRGKHPCLRHEATPITVLT